MTGIATSKHGQRRNSMHNTRIADPSRPGPLAHSARAKRWQERLRCFLGLAEMRVLALGGTPTAWRSAPVRPVLVYSNSVLQYVGGHYRRQQFTETVHRHGIHHWVQTPYSQHWLFGHAPAPNAHKPSVMFRKSSFCR
jgi:hypothetical protein